MLIDDLSRLLKEKGHYHSIEYKSGVCRSTIATWAAKIQTNPKVQNVEAVLNSLGYELKIVKSGESR